MIVKFKQKCNKCKSHLPKCHSELMGTITAYNTSPQIISWQPRVSWHKIIEALFLAARLFLKPPFSKILNCVKKKKACYLDPNLIDKFPVSPSVPRIYEKKRHCVSKWWVPMPHIPFFFIVRIVLHFFIIMTIIVFILYTFQQRLREDYGVFLM